MKQTAVEILCNELTRLRFQFDTEMITVIEYIRAKEQAEQKAKELDKQQIKDAWTDGNCNTDLKGNPSANYAISAEHYYNQKYGSNNEQQ